MASPDGRTQVVFNGEIYNFRELRRDLEGRGYRFRTRSDTEVLVHGWDAWGAGLVPRLDGMFAFALWDEGERQLFLARDRAGKKPLFLHRGEGVVAFASEVKALLASPVVAATPDPASLPHYLAYGYVPGPRTPFRGVEALPPAHRARVGDAGWLEVERYWDLPAGTRRPSTTAARREVMRLLEEAVEKRLLADVPLGAFLSGGVDSAVVVGLMARLRKDPVRTFSIGFQDHPGYDETAAAEATARHFGTAHTAFQVGAQSVELVDDLVKAHDAPFGDSSAIPTWVVSRLARDQVTVALTGDGGDELFAGYQRFAAMGWAESLPAPVSRLAGALAGRLPVTTDFRHPLRRAVRFLAHAGASPAERWLGWVGDWPLPEGLLRESVPPASREALLESVERGLQGEGEATLLRRTLGLNFRTYLPEDLLVKADRCSMAHGLELRSPFLDTALTGYVWTLPDRFKLRGGTGKALLREAVRELVPPAVLARRKQGFAVPLGPWFRGPWRPLLTDRLLAPEARIREWLDPAPIRARVEEHLADRRDHGHFLWKLLTLEVWLERYGGGGTGTLSPDPGGRS